MGKGYTLKDWTDAEGKAFVNEAISKLSKEDTDDFVYKYFTSPGPLSDGGKIYSGQIIIWRQHDEMGELLGIGPRFGVLVSISLFLGDAISEDLHAEFVPIKDLDSLHDKVRELYTKYRDEEEIDRYIKAYEEKARLWHEKCNDMKVSKDDVIDLDIGLKMLNKSDHTSSSSRVLIEKRKEMQYGQKSDQ